jgi:Tfp pilus assembly protein PilF
MNLNHPVRPQSGEPVQDSTPVTVLGRDISPEGFAKALMFLVLLGLIVRIAFFVEHANNVSFGVPTLDQKYYDTVARMLLAGEDLRELHGFRPLLYPMFLAVWYWLGGAWGVDLALFVQHLLGVATGVIVALLGARVFQHRLSGLLGGLLFLLAPVPLYFEGELLIEPSYTFLICAALLVHLRAAGTGGRAGLVLWLVGGALMALAAQARANILVFLPAYPLFAAWCWWRERRWAALLPLAGLAGAVAMLVPWGFVNMRQSEHFHLLPNQGGVALYLGNKRTADGMIPEQERRVTYGGRYEDSVEIWAREEYQKAMRAQGREPDADPMAISDYWTRRAFEEIQAEPVTWLRLMAKKTWLALWNAEVPNNKAFAFLQEEFLWLRWLPVRWVVLLALAPAGLWAAWRRGRRDRLFLLATYAGLYTAGNILFFICDRYRYPVVPVMAVFAGGALPLLWVALRTRCWSRTVGVVASMAVMTAVSLPNWFNARLPSFARDYHFRSLAGYDKGRFVEALADVDRSVELDPSDATAWHHRGNVLFALDRLDEARAAYEQSLRITPEEPGAWNNLGSTLDALGRTEEALQAFGRAIQGQPPSKNAFLGIALIQMRAAQFDAAARTLDQLEALPRGRDAASLATRAVLERRRGNVRAAETLEQQARALDPETAAWALERAAAPGQSLPQQTTPER